MTTAKKEDEKDRVSPPYVSYPTFVTFLDWLKEMPVMPSQLDRSLWAQKFAGSTGSQLMSGLKFLGLLGANNAPTGRLAELAHATNTDRKALMKGTLQETYGPELVDQLASKTPRMLDEQLRALGTTESTHRKAVSFFVNAAKSNDVAVPPAIAKKARIKISRPKGQRQGSSGSKGEGNVAPKNNGGETPTPPSSSANTRTIKLASGGELSLSLTANLLTLAEDDHDFVRRLLKEVQQYADQHPD